MPQRSEVRLPHSNIKGVVISEHPTKDQIYETFDYRIRAHLDIIDRVIVRWADGQVSAPRRSLLERIEP